MIRILAVILFASVSVFAQTQTPSASLIPENTNIPQQIQAQPNQPSAEQIEQQKAIIEQKRKVLKEAFFPEIKPETEKFSEHFLQKYKYYFLALAVVIVVVVIFALRKKKQKILTPYEIAIWQFNAIKKVFEKLEAKPYAEKTSQIVRDYINAVYNIPAPKRTTEEFLKIASEADVFDDKSKEALAKLLHLADMAKFAQHAFNADEKNTMLEASIMFVETDNAKRTQNNTNKK